MTTVEKITQENRERVIEYLRTDVVKNVFAFYDIQHEFDHTTMYIASKNKEIVGYILIYTATDVPSVVLECEKDTAKNLIAYAPENNFIVHTSPEHLQTVVEK